MSNETHDRIRGWLDKSIRTTTLAELETAVALTEVAFDLAELTAQDRAEGVLMTVPQLLDLFPNKAEGGSR